MTGEKNMFTGRYASIMIATGDNPADEDFVELGATRGLGNWDTVENRSHSYVFSAGWDPVKCIINHPCGLVQECEITVDHDESVRYGVLSMKTKPIKSWRYLKTGGKQPRKIKVIMEEQPNDH